MAAPERAPLGAALALVPSLVSLTGSPSPLLMALTVGGLALLTGSAWPALLEIPSRRGTRIVVTGTGIAGALVAALSPDRFAPLSGVVMICAAGVLASFVHQMMRPQRHDLTHSLTGTATGALVAGLASCWVAAQAIALEAGRPELIAVIALGVATTLLLGGLPVPVIVRLLLPLAVGTSLTAVLVVSLLGIAPLLAIGIGLITAVVPASTHVLLGTALVARTPLPSFAVASAPVSVAGVVALLVALLLP